MIDTTSLKSQLTEDRIIELMDALGAPLMKADSNALVFSSVCHHGVDCQSHKPRLYYYVDSASFYCFVCHHSSDAIGLVQHVKHLDFNQAVAYICSTLHLTVADVEQNADLDDWQSMKRWLPNADIEQDEPIKPYNPSILSLFDHLYPQDWLDYGITKDTLDKFGVGWYARQACISIPVVFNGQLVGVRGRYTREQDVAKGKYRPITTLDGQVLKFQSGQLFYAYDQNKDVIKKCKNVILFEAEKSCLKAASRGINNTLAVFGSNVSKRQVQLLLELGVNEVTIGFDSDFVDTNGEDFRFFATKIKKIARRLTPYFTVFCAYNNQGYDGYKYSPMDFTDEQMKKIFENRVKIS